MRTLVAAILLAAPLLSAGVSRQMINVGMRDGVVLATDLYNASPDSPRPVLLCRTPYNKDGQKQIGEKYSRHGYTVVVQDCRGRYASAGDYTPYNDDRQDGYDTVEWINRQPWSNGRVGMFGSSHLGLVQWLAMAEGAPGLVAIAPGFTASSLYRVAYREGALRMALISAGGTRANPPPEASPLPAEMNLLHYHLPLMHLPLASLEEAFGWKLPWMTSLLRHPRFDGFWRQTSAERDIPATDLPVQLITGYYDFFHHDTVQDFFRLRARRSKAPVQLILGPWIHGSSGRTKTQDHDFGLAAKIEITDANLEWFEKYVKGSARANPRSRGSPNSSVVRYFVIGENKWRNATDWPPPDSTPAYLYLNAGRQAGFEAPKDAGAASQFVSDPAKPTPSIPPDRRDISRSALWSPLDYTPVGNREDVLSWTTSPLAKPLVFAGPLKADLWVDADTEDADWIVRLFAIAPDSAALPLAHGILRQSTAPKASQSPHQITVDLGSCAASLPRGYRLRVEIAGSSFPMYDRNLHTGQGPFGSRGVIAKQTVFHHRARPSRIILPLLPK